MRETPLSNCERQFLLKAIEEKKRLDGRQTYDYRNIKITFGTDYGCCVVDVGKTRVLAQVSCELVAPKDNRPTEGIMFINLELSPMASPAFESGRQSELHVTLNRLLERCLRNSKCLDTESLCVVSGEKVWKIRIDVHVLNHDGNIMDAASIAAITALCHFRRPDVGIQGEEVTIVLRCNKIASVKVCEITELINKALENDRKVKKEGGKFGFAESMAKERITALKSEIAPVEMIDIEEKAEDIICRTGAPCDTVPSPVVRAPGTGQVGEGLQNAWGLDEVEEEEEEEDDIEQGGPEKQPESETITSKKGDVVVISDSEEEEVVILHQGVEVKDFREEMSSGQKQATSASKKKKKKRKLAH
nr:exosome complex component RRP45 isoform X2 [Paramormyrops kingsleyae]